MLTQIYLPEPLNSVGLTPERVRLRRGRLNLHAPNNILSCSPNRMAPGATVIVSGVYHRVPREAEQAEGST